jgi:hypothetical protein
MMVRTSNESKNTIIHQMGHRNPQKGKKERTSPGIFCFNLGPSPACSFPLRIEVVLYTRGGITQKLFGGASVPIHPSNQLINQPTNSITRQASGVTKKRKEKTRRKDCMHT